MPSTPPSDALAATLARAVARRGPPLAARLLQRDRYEEGEPGDRPGCDVGDTGPGIELLQSLLGVKTTGVFDRATRNAASAFQQSRGWKPGGVGAMTWEALEQRAAALEGTSGAEFDLEMCNPLPSGCTGNYGGPGMGGHSSADWFIGFGMDLAADAGTEVQAAFDGYVSKIDRTKSESQTPPEYGVQIFVRDHGDRMGGFYTHLREVPDNIQVGSHIVTEQFLGTVCPSKGVKPHLHFAVMEIIGGTRRGVNLNTFFMTTTKNSSELKTVTFFRDGRRQPRPAP
jgi:murein DD-endopeptidase MepM/ murein hydrolase activator NlpD